MSTNYGNVITRDAARAVSLDLFRTILMFED